jgi:hypothetical protein
VVRAFLIDPKLDTMESAALEKAGFATDGFAGDDALRSMVTLAWLHHVVGNIAKSERYVRSRLWTAANVDWVLDIWLPRTPGGRP